MFSNRSYLTNRKWIYKNMSNLSYIKQAAVWCSCIIQCVCSQGLISALMPQQSQCFMYINTLLLYWCIVLYCVLYHYSDIHLILKKLRIKLKCECKFKINQNSTSANVQPYLGMCNRSLFHVKSTPTASKCEIERLIKMSFLHPQPLNII